MPANYSESQDLYNKYANLLASIPLAFIETDSDWNIRQWNKAAEKLFQQTYDQAFGKNIFDIIPFEPQDVFYIKSISTESAVHEFAHTTKTEKIICRWNVVKNDALDSKSFIVEDISILHATEYKLQQALYKEIELNRLKSNFIANTSHQFRTPLTTILSNTEMLEVLLAGKIGEEKVKIDRFIGRIYDNIDRMNMLLSDLVLSGKLQADATKIQREPVKLIEIIMQTVGNENLPNLNGRNFEINEVGEPKIISADKHLLGIVVNNLLSNALKYSNGNPIISIEYLTEYILFTVTDHGIGIPEAEQANLFQTFFRATNVENIGGTGLGLFLVNEYVKLHGGTVTFKSIPNEGTSFFVKLPYNKEK